MLEWIDKRNVTWGDIEKLVENQQIENEQVEFKQALHTKDGSQHPWYTGSERIDGRARDELISELIALANTHGGWLFLGIAESSSKPPRAEKIVSVPRCDILAQKLYEMIDGCVGPKIPDFKVVPVLSPSGGAGVLVLQTGRSPLAPHRLESTKEVFIRRHDRCVEATMTEISDLAIRTQRKKVEALWTATFSSGSGPKNGGVVVLDEGRLFGGDANFYYEGRYEVDGDAVKADFRAHHYHGESLTAFGDHAPTLQLIARCRHHGSQIKGQLERLGFSHPPVDLILTRKQNLP